MKIWLFAALLFLPVAAQAQTISGPATAVDGDSLSLTGVAVRLHGVDAPEAMQTCQRDGAVWQCGQDAAALLAELVVGQRVICEQRDIDPYGRIVAICRVGRLDLSLVMVQAGLAVALSEFSDAYVESEARARLHRIGLWSSEFETPASYRAANPRDRSPAAYRNDLTERVRPPRDDSTHAAEPGVTGCVIKGNRNRRGEWIYHLPGMPYYYATRPEEIFCTEAQAQTAGYRRAIVRQ